MGHFLVDRPPNTWYCPWLMVTVYSICFVSDVKGSRKSSLGAQGLCTPHFQALSLPFPLFYVLCLSLIHATFCQFHHSVWMCGVYECVRVCLLLIKSRANVAAHTKAWQRQGNLSICRHGMIIKSHPSDRYWQEQIGLGKQRQLVCARAHWCACVRERVYLCGCSHFEMVRRDGRGEKKSSPVRAGKAMANWA